MFTKTRIKLTLWYLLIIMLVSSMFSVVIYRMLSSEIERFDQLQRTRIERRMPETVPPFHIPEMTPELLTETKQRIFFMLAFVNCGIFVFAGLLGYVLAGKTLAPISEMMDEQNRFISDASHELRTPLTSLKSAFEVFLRSRTPTIAEAKTVVSESIEEVNKLQSLSESLLNLAQYEKPNGSMQFETINLSTVLKEAIKRVESEAKQKSIRVSTSLQNITIQGNSYGLTDLFTILLDNAIKYSSVKGTIHIQMKKTDRTVEVAIKDNGIGISETDIPHIFNRFYRADNARSKNQAEGYGLGLSIAQKIVSIHNGTIHVTSNIGKGSTFVVHLPIS
jgi:two-component system, OmpR family, sensor histidine kinase CiaH